MRSSSAGVGRGKPLATSTSPKLLGDRGFRGALRKRIGRQKHFANIFRPQRSTIACANIRRRQRVFFCTNSR